MQLYLLGIQDSSMANALYGMALKKALVSS